jgi:hypothetical protein
MKCTLANCFLETPLQYKIIYTLLIRMNGEFFDNSNDASDAVTWNFFNSWVEFQRTWHDAKIWWLYVHCLPVLGPCVRFALRYPVGYITFVFNHSVPASVHGKVLSVFKGTIIKTLVPFWAVVGIQTPESLKGSRRCEWPAPATRLVV